MKRIAITGTHGVGKTSLAYALFDKFTELNIKASLNTKLARSLIEKGYPLGKEATSESYIQYIISQLRAEQTAEKCDVFISDRTLLDPLSYSIVNQKYINSTVPDDIIKLLESVWLLESIQYDLYVLVPIEFEMPIDDIRPVDKKYRERIETQIASILSDYCINYITVSGTIDERADKVLNSIGIQW